MYDAMSPDYQFLNRQKYFSCVMLLSSCCLQARFGLALDGLRAWDYSKGGACNRMNSVMIFTFNGLIENSQIMSVK